MFYSAQVHTKDQHLGWDQNLLLVIKHSISCFIFVGGWFQRHGMVENPNIYSSADYQISGWVYCLLRLSQCQFHFLHLHLPSFASIEWCFIHECKKEKETHSCMWSTVQNHFFCDLALSCVYTDVNVQMNSKQLTPRTGEIITKKKTHSQQQQKQDKFKHKFIQTIQACKARSGEALYKGSQGLMRQ